MKNISNSWLSVLMVVSLMGNACAVERPQPPLEYRVKNAELVIVADDIQRLPMAGKEFDKFYRVQVRIAGVLKGHANVGDHIEVVVNNTIAELRNDCCETGKIYVMFLSKDGGKYSFVGNPLGAVPVELLEPKTIQAGATH